ncbi:GNAT family N-acetyltransferase [Acinetobacter sp. YH12102]|uniref:GNAT family N-acetyltransferase n=1 Tax=Acinetobacter sp. YH12102 TaxID=2601091 RepID=UPI0035A13B15
MPSISIQPPSLILRQWKDSDTDPFIQMCTDDEVMYYFPKKLNRDNTLMSRTAQRYFDSINKSYISIFMI